MTSMATTKDVIQHFFLTKLYSCKELPTTQETKKQEIGCPVSYLQMSSPTSVSRGGEACSAQDSACSPPQVPGTPCTERTAPVLYSEMAVVRVTLTKLRHNSHVKQNRNQLHEQPQQLPFISAVAKPLVKSGASAHC